MRKNKWRKLAEVLLVAGVFRCGMGTAVAGSHVEVRTESNGYSYTVRVQDGNDANSSNNESKSVDYEREKARAACAEALANYKKEYDTLCKLENEYKELKKIYENTSPEITEDLKDLKAEALKNMENALAAVESQKRKLIVEEARLELAGTTLRNANKAYAAVHNPSSLVGDPVHIGSGQYVADYVDFVASGSLSDFSVERNLLADGDSESFGLNWSCSLDSRIIRCRTEPLEQKIKITKEILESSKKALNICSDYQSSYSSYPDGTINSNAEQMKAMIKACENRIAVLEKINEKNLLADSHNKFVTYGRYSKPQNYMGTEGMVKYCEPDGNEITFVHDESGIWKTSSKFLEHRIWLYGLDLNQQITEDVQAPGGFLLCFEDGRTVRFDEFGILRGQKDKNGNQRVYKSKNGKIFEVELESGEVINITRNSEGKITSVEGTSGKKAVYEYSNGKLVSVVADDGIKVGFEYDDENNLIAIKKADGSFVSIEYEFNSEYGRKVVAATVNEEGFRESFAFDKVKGELSHKTYGGKSELHRWNIAGNTVYSKTADGKECFFEYDEDGFIVSSDKDGYREKYDYDEKNRIERVITENGAQKAYEYTDFGLPAKITDADGFWYSFDYDEKGNLLRSSYCGSESGHYDYYENGLLKTAYERGVEIHFEYNSAGLVTKKTIIDSKGNHSEYSDYDSSGRLIKKVDANGLKTVYEYESDDPEAKVVTERIGSIKETKRIFNSRGREIEKIETDLKSEKKIVTKKEYDGCGNLQKVFVNDVLLVENNYLPDGLLNYTIEWNAASKDSVIARQGIKTVYERDSNYEIVRVIKETVDSSDEGKYSAIENGKLTVEVLDYAKTGNQKRVQVRSGTLNPCVYTYDAAGKLVKIQSPDGYWKNYHYTAAGRIKGSNDSEFTVYECDYKKNGNCLVTVRTKGGAVASYEYDSFDNLLKARNFAGDNFSYKYDEYGNQCEIATPNYTVAKSYDIYGREVDYSLSDRTGRLWKSYSVNFDDENLVQKLFYGTNLYEQINYDAWGNPVEVKNKNGTNLFEYDVLGNCIKRTDGAGVVSSAEYTVFGKPAYVCKGGGVEEFYRYLPSGNLLSGEKSGNQTKRVLFCNEFDASGLLTQTVDHLGGKTTIEYDSNGNLLTYSKFNTGKVSLTENSGRDFTVLAGGEKILSYEIDGSGSVLTETNSAGKTARYNFDRAGRKISKVNFSGLLENYYYDAAANSVMTEFSNGEKSKIVSNPLGQIVELVNDVSEIYYDYDSFGNLISIFDAKAQVSVEYDYDELGRCISKKGDFFDLKFEYDSCGAISKVTDKLSGNWVKIFYNSQGKESKREFSNGVCWYTCFDDLGEKVASYSMDGRGQCISADFVLFNESGRVEAVCNLEGEITKYQYYSDGRLLTAEYKYTEDILKKNQLEAEECGFGIKNQEPQGTELGLTYEAVERFKNLFEQAGLGNKIKIDRNQYSWKEEYSYYETGEIKSVKNPYGTIFYEYDSMHRLVSKHSANNTDGMKLTWNADGCLEKIQTPVSKTSFKYGAAKRPVLISCENLLDSSIYNLTYTYDPLGRRISETVNDGDSRVFVYDGLSCTELLSIPTVQNSLAVSNYWNAEDFSSTAELSRLISDGDYSASQENKAISDTSGYTVYDDARGLYRVKAADEKNENRGGVTVLFETDNRPYATVTINGVPSLVSYGSNGGYQGNENEYLLNNYRGEVSEIYSDSTASAMAVKTDVWGNPIGEQQKTYYSLSKQILGTSFNLYNLGYRDYSPALKSFTTEDPARDGINWYAYCPTDPVNYFDPDGRNMGYTESHDLMTKYPDLPLGNSETEKVGGYGCYITTAANVLRTAYLEYGIVFSKPEYMFVEGINNDKSLFSKQEGKEGDLDKGWERIFGDQISVESYEVDGKSIQYETGDWDYWTKDHNTKEQLTEKLQKYAASDSTYLVFGTFSIVTASGDKIPTHMVALNGLPDENGQFNIDTIGPSSENDTSRLNSKLAKYYNMEYMNKYYVLRVDGIVQRDSQDNILGYTSNKNCSK